MLLRQIGLLATCLFASTIALAGTQRALLIGVSEYEANLTPLAGARNDVFLIRELLVQKYGFDPANIRILLDDEATRAQVLGALAQISEIARSDDIVLVHYSGHGSQAPDTNGDEPDGFDETIVPYDARTPGVPDITDDELNDLIGRIKAQSVVVILDSCHSGTGTRGGPSLVTQRWVAPDTRKDLYKSTVSRQVVTLPISEQHVFFAAAQEHESELDGPFGPDDLRLGLFTAAMVGVLANSRNDVSPREAIAGVSAQIESLKASAAGMPIPEPNMEAPTDKQEQPMFVFTKAALPAVSDGSFLQFSGGGQERFRIMETLFATSNGVADRQLGERIVRFLDGKVRLAKSVEQADAVVDHVGGRGMDVYGPAGNVQIASGLQGTGIETDFGFLVGPLRNAPALAELVSIRDSQSGPHLTMKAAGVSETRARSISTRAVRVSVNTDNHRLRFYNEGERRTRENSLQLVVRSNVDCYLTLVSVDSKGAAYVLFPNAGQELSGFLSDGRIHANQDVLIPDTLADDNRAGFYFDYAPPGGTDRVVGVCFANANEAASFRAQLETLERGDVLERPLLHVASRGLTNVAPGKPTNTQPTLSEPPPQAVKAGWAAAILTLDVGVGSKSY